MRPLNTNDGWENIVNANAMQKASARERVAAKKRERRLRKLWLSVCGATGIGITFLILGSTGACDGWLAAAVMSVSVMAGSFLLGRFVEAKRG